VQHIHDSGVIHLDLKPANVLITFEGVLKIADFGMASTWPAPPGIEGEGDREYIGPEVLLGQFDKPADIFALGLIMLEIAGNVELPENGPSWQKLRTGDMSDVPSLTWSSDSHVARDASGNPVSPPADGPAASAAVVSEAGSGFFDAPALSSTCGRYGRAQPQPTLQSPARPTTPRLTVRRDGELRQPPSFMVDPHHEQALDRLVRWMISPKPHDRPAVNQLLDSVGVKWAESRRRAGAIVFEGNWGPADTVLCGDTVMLDV
jgi:mitosis inhibitor protein kinase SWE1